MVVLARAAFGAAAAREVDAEPRLLPFRRRFVRSRVPRVAGHVAPRRRRLALLHPVAPIVPHPATVPDVVLIVALSTGAVRSDPFHLLTRWTLQKLLVLAIVRDRQRIAGSSTSVPSSARGDRTHFSGTLPLRLAGDCVDVI